MESLEETCLGQIIEDIDMHSACYAKSEGTPLALHYEFLRRVYSNALFSRMLITLEEEHLDFLISPYLKHLDIRHVDKKLIRGIASRLKANGNGIKTVKARFSKLLYEQLIPSLSNLVDIEIGGFSDTRGSSIHGIYTSEMIKSLGRCCPELRVLKLRDDEGGYSAGDCLLSDDIKLCPKLYESVCYLLDKCPSVEILENINTVEILYKRHKLDFQNNDLEKHRKYSLTKLSFLDGQNYPLLDAFKICYSLCPNVMSIELHWISGNQLVKCPDFVALQDVKILFGTATIGDMNHFLKVRGSRIVSMELYHPRVSVQTLIKCCPELKHLTLSSVVKFKPVKREDFSLAAVGLPKLKSFFIDQTSFSQMKSREAFKLIISAAKNLENVHVRSMRGFSEEFCNTIFELGLRRVRELDVGRTDMPLSFLTKLLLEGSIETMDVWHCSSVNSDQACDALLRCKRDNQTVNVTCRNGWAEDNFYSFPNDEWYFPDIHGFPASKYDYDFLDMDSDDDDDDLESYSSSDFDSDLVYDSDDAFAAFVNFVLSS